MYSVFLKKECTSFRTIVIQFLLHGPFFSRQRRFRPMTNLIQVRYSIVEPLFGHAHNLTWLTYRRCALNLTCVCLLLPLCAYWKKWFTNPIPLPLLIFPKTTTATPYLAAVHFIKVTLQHTLVTFSQNLYRYIDYWYKLYKYTCFIF